MSRPRACREIAVSGIPLASILLLMIMVKATTKLLILLALSLACGCSFGEGQFNTIPDGAGDLRNEMIVEDDGMWEEDWIENPLDDSCTPCQSDEDCENDGVFCNGYETCDLSQINPVTGTYCCVFILPCSENPSDCMEYTCIEELQQCVENPMDQDDDGYIDADCEGGSDCDDDLYSVHPGATEICNDGLDNDCDSTADEDAWTGTSSPVRLSASNCEVLDAAMETMDDQWVIAWSDTSDKGSFINIAVYNNESIEPNLPEPLNFEIDGDARDVALLTGQTGEIYIIWTESDRFIKGKMIESYPDIPEGEPVTIFQTTGSSTISDIAAVKDPGNLYAGLFFRSQEHGNFEIYMAALDLDSFPGPVETAVTRITSAVGFSGYPSAASNESACVLTWEDERDGNKEIYVTTVNIAEGSAGIPSRITVAPSDSRLPSVTASSSGFRVVWMDESGGAFNIMAAQLDSGGTPINFPIAMGESSEAKFYPYASPDPREPDHLNQHLVVYTGGEEKKLYLTAISDRSVEIQPGIEIVSSARKILAPAISEGQTSRALIWIDSDHIDSELHFLIMECM